MREGETGKRDKVTPHSVEKSVSEKSQDTYTCNNPIEKSCSQQEYFVRVVKDRRTGKNGSEFLIG